MSRAPRLMLVSDARRARRPLLDLAAEAVAGGVDTIYLRDVELPTAELCGLVKRLRQRIGARVAILINGEPEVARALGTGLHLRERDMPAAEARAWLGPEALIGRAVHAPASAALATGADYVLAGHVFASASKPGTAPLGVGGLAAIVAAAPCPVVAIGGISPDRVGDVVRAGASGIAVIGAIAESETPREAAAALRTALDRELPRDTKESAMNRPTDTASSPSAVEIVVNGKSAVVPDAATVHDFLASKRMTDAMAIVERNGVIVPRGEYAATVLRAGDRLEVVHAVGGG